MTHDAAPRARIHHPSGVIPPDRGRENIDLRLVRTMRRRGACRQAWEVEHD